MRDSVIWGLAFASILTVEGTSHARTTESSVGAWVEESDEEGASAIESVLDSAPASLRSSSDREPAERPGDLARIVLCHSSHHPRDGLRPDQHACPLFIAVKQPSAVDPLPGTFVAFAR
jgi:hypothetical protein